MDNFIPVNEPLLGEREKELVCKCIDTGWISSEGPFVEQFEESFSRKVNRKFGVSCSSGTAALDLAIAALKISNGDEVIMPNFTIISCAAAIVKNGGKPVLIDADRDTWNMNTAHIEAAITSKTVAIMAVHIYGIPTDMDPIIDIAKKYNLKIIEDSAELIGAKYKDRPCGSFGHISTFSFYPNKHITTGEGGMVVTNDPILRDRCRSLRNLCFQKNKRFIHNELGWNYRMTNIQAALGIAQLEKLDKTINIKLQIGRKYNKFLENVPQIKIPLMETNYAKNIYWVYGILIEPSFGDAQKVINLLSKLKINTRPFFYPMHKQPVFKKMGLFKNQTFKISNYLYNQGLYLPSGLTMNNEKIESVVKKLKSIIC